MLWRGLGYNGDKVSRERSRMKELITEKEFEIRFSEVDLMKVVWHGSYPLYLEDAREAFGAEYGLSYQNYIDHNVFAPIVKMDIDYKRPLIYGMKPHIRIKYVPKASAKIIFDYEIFNPEDGTVFVKARTIQVFMDTNYELLWDSPEFFVEWRRKWDVEVSI